MIKPKNKKGLKAKRHNPPKKKAVASEAKKGMTLTHPKANSSATPPKQSSENPKEKNLSVSQPVPETKPANLDDKKIDSSVSPIVLSSEKKSFFQSLFPFFRKKSPEKTNSEKEEVDSARKRLETELGEKYTHIKERKISEETEKDLFKEDLQRDNNPKSKIFDKKELFSVLDKTNAGEVLNSLDKKSKESILNKISSINFESYNDFEDTIVSDLAGLLKDSYDDLSLMVNDLIKSGGEGEKLSLRLMEIPLKINLFKSAPSKRDFDNVNSLINSIKTELSELQKYSEDIKKNSLFEFEKEVRANSDNLQNPNTGPAKIIVSGDTSSQENTKNNDLTEIQIKLTNKKKQIRKKIKKKISSKKKSR